MQELVRQNNEADNKHDRHEMKTYTDDTIGKCE